MKTTLDKTKTTLIALLAIVILLSGLMFISRNSLKKDLYQEKIKSEKLFSEKMKLDENTTKLKEKVAALANKITDQENIIKKRTNELMVKQNEINQLAKEKGTASILKTKLTELEAIQNKLKADLEQKTVTSNALKDELAKLNELLLKTQEENQLLTSDNAFLKAMVADNYRVEAFRGKSNHLTINGKRTKKLSVSFDLPDDVVNGVHFTLIDPKGNGYSSLSTKNMSIKMEDNTDRLVASTEDIRMPGSKRTEMVYKPDHKLQKGIYIIKIYNNEEYLGSTQIRFK